MIEINEKENRVIVSSQTKATLPNEESISLNLYLINPLVATIMLNENLTTLEEVAESKSLPAGKITFADVQLDCFPHKKLKH